VLQRSRRPQAHIPELWGGPAVRRSGGPAVRRSGGPAAACGAAVRRRLAARTTPPAQFRDHVSPGTAV